MALGAGRNDTLRLVLRDVATLGMVRIAIGLPLALTATQLMSKLLFGVGPRDPVLAFAGFLPARRATAMEPSAVLRVT